MLESNIRKYYLYTILTQLRFTRIVNILFVVQFLHFNVVTFALLQSIFLLSQTIAELPSGMLGDWWRKKGIVGLGLCVLAVSPFLMLLGATLGFYALLGAFILEGVRNALLSGADDALFYEAIRDEGFVERYGQVRGRVQLIGAITVGLATFVGGIAYSRAIYLPYLLQAIMLIVALVLLQTVPESPAVEMRNIEGNRIRPVKRIAVIFKAMLKVPQILLMFLLFALIGAVINAVFAIMPAYVATLGINASVNGLIFMAYSFAGGIVAAQAFRLSKVSMARLGSLLGLVVIGGAVLQIQTNSILFLIGVGFLYVVVDILDPLVMTQLHEWVADNSRATLLSGLSFLTVLSTMILNPVIGWLSQHFGVQIMLMAAGCTIIIMIISMLWWLFKHQVDSKKA